MSVYLLPEGIVPVGSAAPLIRSKRAWSLGDGRGFTAAWVWRRGGIRRLITPNSPGADEADEQLANLAAPRRVNGGDNRRPQIMAIINATPDSFSDGGDNLEASRAIANGERMLAEGADILDVGGESTRPGASPVSEDEELRRVLPIIEGLAKRGARISVDTQKAEVMRRALAAGASIINDVSALEGDGCLEVAAAADAEIVLMHKKGTPMTMQDNPRYDDLLAEVYDYLKTRLETCLRAGIAKERLMLDVGIGFAKTAAHNGELLRALPMFYGLGCRLALGASRKRFVSAMSRDEQPKQRLGGSIAAVLAANIGGDDVVRTHDVAASRQALDVYGGIVGY